MAKIFNGVPRVCAIGGIAFVCFVSGFLRGAQPELPILPDSFLARLSDEARTQFEAAYARLKEPSPNSILAGQLGMIAQAHEQHRLALSLYAIAEAGSPEAFEWPYYSGTAHNVLGETQAALDAFLRAQKLSPDYVPLKLNLADVLFDLNRWEESRTLYQAVILSYPDLPSAHFGLGKCLRELGDSEQAIEHFREACRLYPNYGSAHYALAQAYRTAGQMDKAKAEMDLYQQHRLHRPVVGDGLLNAIAQLKTGAGKANDLLKEGIALGERGDLEGAIARHLEAVAANPGLLQAQINLIILYGKSGNMEGAAASFARAIELEENSAEAYYNYGVALFTKERYDEASQSFQKALSIDPTYALAFNYIGQVSERKGKFSEAEQAYREALEQAADLRIAHFNLARMLITQGKYDEAILELERLLEQEDEQTAHHLFAVATAHVRAGRFEEGLQFAEKALAKAEELGLTQLRDSIQRNIAQLRKSTGKQP